MESRIQLIDEESIPDLFDDLDRTTCLFGALHPQTVDVANRLAISLWRKGDLAQATSILEQGLEALSSNEPTHPVRCKLLGTLAEIMIELACWDRAAALYRDILANCNHWYGSNHARSLMAKSDLSFVLFELEEAEEALALEQQAFEGARQHLGRKHPVSCVVAWNRSQRLERTGSAVDAHSIVMNDLIWLLHEDDVNLDADVRAVKVMLADRCGWQTAAVC